MPTLTAPPIDRTRFRLDPKHYFPQVLPKDMIMLHFTAGASAASAFTTWSSVPDGHVAAPYIVDVDGSIHEIFDPQYWAYHLGVDPAHSQSWKHDKRSIAIEIVNVGPLRPDKQNPRQLNWWPPRNEFATKFCMLEETAKYVHAPYRGLPYFAPFPPLQIDAVVALVDYVASKYSIAKSLPPVEKRSAFDLAYFDTYKGIASHQNFRPDKFDVGPAFPWDRLRQS